MLPARSSVRGCRSEGKRVVVQYLEENVGALGIELTPEVKAELEDIFHPDLVRSTVCPSPTCVVNEDNLDRTVQQR